jgi:hypothetical protein
MTFGNKILGSLLLCISSLTASNVIAATFNIAPQGGSGNLPTQVVTGQTAIALYTITNISGVAINGYGLRTTSLPANIAQTTSTGGVTYHIPLCSTTISLAAGDSCTLKFAITGGVTNGTFLLCNSAGTGGHCTSYTQSPLNVSEVSADRAAAQISLDVQANTGTSTINVPTTGAPYGIVLTNATTGIVANNLSIANLPTGVTLVGRSGDCDTLTTSQSCTLYVSAGASFIPGNSTIQGSNTNQITITLQPASTTALTLSPIPSTLRLTNTNPALMTFQTTPATPGVVVSVAQGTNLPDGVTSDVSCTTQANGSCPIHFTASVSGYGSKAITVTATGVASPATPTITVGPTTLIINDGSPMGLTPDLTVANFNIRNNGPFIWAAQKVPSGVTYGNFQSGGLIPLPGGCGYSSVNVNASCTIGLQANTSAQPGDTATVTLNANAQPHAIGTIYVEGGVSLAWETATLNKPTDIANLVVTNSTGQSITFTNASFTNGDILNVPFDTHACTQTPLADRASCKIIFVAIPSSFQTNTIGDSVTVNYLLNGTVSESVVSSNLVVTKTTINLTTPDSQAAQPNSTVSLQPETPEQTFTVWVEGDFNLMNANISVGSTPIGLTSQCSNNVAQASNCTFFLNTAGVASNATATLTISGSNLAPLTWNININPWMPAISIDTGLVNVLGLSCPSILFCGAIDKSVGLYTGDPTQIAERWVHQGLDGSKSNLASISCADESHCLVVGKQGYLYGWYLQNGAPAWGAAFQLPGTTTPIGVSCPDANHCFVVATNSSTPLIMIGTSNDTSIYSSGSTNYWTEKDIQSFQSLPTPGQISCPSTNYCLFSDAVTKRVYANTTAANFDVWAAFNTVDFVSAITCQSDNLCVVIDKSNRIFTLDLTSQIWSLKGSITNESSFVVHAIACATNHSCVAAGNDSNGQEAALVGDPNPSSWVNWTKTQVSSDKDSLISVSCPQNNRCVVITNTGKFYNQNT